MGRKKTVSEEEVLSRTLLGQIEKNLTIAGETNADLALTIGTSQRTVCERRKKPGAFTMTELRRMCKHFGWTAEILCELFGVEQPHTNVTVVLETPDAKDRKEAYP